MRGGSGSSQAELRDEAETAQEQTCMTCKVKMTGRQNKDGFPQSAHPGSDFGTKQKFGITPEMSVNFFLCLHIAQKHLLQSVHLFRLCFSLNSSDC